MGNYSLHLCAGWNLHEVARCPGKGDAIGMEAGLSLGAVLPLPLPP